MSQLNPPESQDELVSIVIPCYKQGHYLAATIESALQQDYPHVEVIVVNDGSPDDTDAVAAQFEGRIVYVKQANTGLPGARNAGIKKARGSFLVFLDSDDQLLPSTLRLQMRSIAEHSADIAICSYVEFDDQGNLGKRRSCPPLPVDLFHNLLGGNIMPPVCFIMRRTLLEQVGDFTQGAFYGVEDWELWLRAAAAGGVFCPSEAEVLYRTYANSMSGNAERMFIGMLTTLRDFKHYHPHCKACRRGRRIGRMVARSAYLLKVKEQFLHPIRRSRGSTLLHFAWQLCRRPQLWGSIVRMSFEKPSQEK